MKQLENITQVPHDDDYNDFKRDSQSNTSTVSLPNISCEGRIKRRKRKPKNGNNSIKNKQPTNSSDIHSQSDKKSALTHIENNQQIHLPRIINRSAVISVSSNSNGKNDRLDVSSRVGYREVISPTGMTSIFHSLQAGISNNDVTNNVGLTSQKVPKDQHVNNPSLIKTMPRMFENKIHTSQDQLLNIYKSLRKETSLPIYRKETSLTISEPLTDQRYERLKRSLIIQDPPNEGYTELSPSFVREDPDWMLRHRQQQLSAARKRRLRNKLRRRLSVEFIRRPDSAGSEAQDLDLGDQASSDDNDEEEVESRSNSALRKMAIGNSFC